MSAADQLGLYAKGWTNGDANTILQALSNDYILDDPNVGNISKEKLSDYLDSMKETVKSLHGGNLPDPFMELSEVVTSEDSGILTAWCAWNVPDTNIRGAGLIKVNSSGVFSEVLTYYTSIAS